ncbi:FecR family protein [Luteibacter aegosomatissinici]|uniref:FecR family protein n=1 Tax=Luteibacter aegosomatissinici TaxID=2911539 RepID=UPI001FF83D87|nr:FecR domain-containing protein [Luteibacter aegosomatissinici]UPG92599.1 FecR domain-containing protein [Luteibacter aegosomatissinici]
MHDEIRQAAARRISEEAGQWLLASRAGLDEPSRIAFVNWLRHSPAHVAEYMAMVQLDQEMKDAAGHEPLAAPALVKDAANEPAVVPLRPRAAHAAHPEATRHARTPRRRRWPWMATATATAAAIAVATVIAWPAEPSVTGIIYSAGANATRSLDLADGSRIQLDRGSAIRVQFDNQRRDITVLAGTMLIDVGHDASTPLSVTLGRTVLRDIGTVFQVSTKSDGGDVTVLSGRVDVLAPRDSWPWPAGSVEPQTVIAHLQGGERATLSGDGHVTHVGPRADLSEDLAWLPGEIDFHDTPVAEVARRFNAYGHAPLLIEDDSVASTRISGRFHARDSAGFVAYLQTLPGVQVRRDEEGVHVVRHLRGANTARL